MSVNQVTFTAADSGTGWNGYGVGGDGPFGTLVSPADGELTIPYQWTFYGGYIYADTFILQLLGTVPNLTPPATAYATITVYDDTADTLVATLVFSDATYTADPGDVDLLGQWEWDSGLTSLTNGHNYTVTFNPVGGFPATNGDIIDPNAWEDENGNTPPLQFQNVPQTLNYPLNGDGRYWWQGNANGTSGEAGPITFVGDDVNYGQTGTMALTWQVAQLAGDGSYAYLEYSTDGGATFTTVILSNGLESGLITVALPANTGLQVNVTFAGGAPTVGAPEMAVAVAITRNADQGPTFDYPNPLNPAAYNGVCVDAPGYDTLSTLQTRMLIRLGFSNQTTNPPPGMLQLLTEFLQSAQNFLYRRYNQLRNKRFFRWKLVPGQRFYSLLDNDEDVLCNYAMEPSKAIDWAGVQDTRNVWYPLIQGIPPQLYTMIAKPWRPARYDLRQGLEVYPAPDQTYFLWMKAHFGLQSFVNPDDMTTIDSELVFLHALANAKAHYGQPDAENIEAQANVLRLELVAVTHQSARYVPGTVAVPPAVRPTLIQYQDNQGG
jgi:hypothetical protein